MVAKTEPLAVRSVCIIMTQENCILYKNIWMQERAKYIKLYEELLQAVMFTQYC
jgi:hypothetical protein